MLFLSTAPIAPADACACANAKFEGGGVGTIACCWYRGSIGKPGAEDGAIAKGRGPSSNIGTEVGTIADASAVWSNKGTEVGSRIGGDIGTAGKSSTAEKFERLATCEGRGAGGPAGKARLPRFWALPVCGLCNKACVAGCLLSDRERACEDEGSGNGHGCGGWFSIVSLLFQVSNPNEEILHCAKERLRLMTCNVLEIKF